MARKSPSRKVEQQVLTRSRRRCCFCAYLEGNWREQPGQLAHIDRNHANSSFENLAWLCLRHHNEYDSRTSQSKGLTATELKEYRDRLYSAVDAVVQRNELPPRIKVHAAPMVCAGQLWARLRIENVSSRPVRLNSWYCRHAPQRLFEAILELPNPVLREREQVETDICIGISPDNADLVEALAVVDSDENRTFVPQDCFAQFSLLAIRESAIGHLRPVDPTPDSMEGQHLSIAFCTRPSSSGRSLSLVATIHNTGNTFLPLLRARICWEYSPARIPREPVPDDRPVAEEVGGSVAITRRPTSGGIGPGEVFEYTFDEPWNATLVDAAAKDVRPGSLRFELQTSKKYAWTEADNLANLIESVARSVLASRAKTVVRAAGQVASKYSGGGINPVPPVNPSSD